MKRLKSKFVTFVLALCLIIPGVFMLTACGDDHTHTLTKIDAVTETCTADGNTLYYKCDCGKYFSDEEAKTEIEKDSWVVAKTGHSWGEGVITTPATPSADGVITYTCHCSETKTETFAYTNPSVVTDGEWLQAFDDAMSKTVDKTIVLFHEGSTEPTMTVMVKENIFYTYSGSYELLLTTLDGNYDMYEKMDGSWTKETLSEESYNNQIQYYWDNLFGYFRCSDLEIATFSEVDGTYTYSTVFSGSTTVDYIAKFMNGKLTEWTICALNNKLTFDFTEPTIEIPQV